jgi:hypothetical protein
VILNLTPHPIRIYAEDRPDGHDDLDWGLLHVIDPEQAPARLEMEASRRRYIDGVPVETVVYGAVDGLPAATGGVRYIVSLPIALALTSKRRDLLIPYREVRNATGTTIGCRQLAQPV